MVPEGANFDVPHVGIQTVRFREAFYDFIDVKTRRGNFLFIVIMATAIMKGNMPKESPFSCFSALSRTEPESGEGGWIKLKSVNKREIFGTGRLTFSTSKRTKGS
jgi:hypothetical protein